MNQILQFNYSDHTLRVLLDKVIILDLVMAFCKQYTETKVYILYKLIFHVQICELK